MTPTLSLTKSFQYQVLWRHEDILEQSWLQATLHSLKNGRFFKKGSLLPDPNENLTNFPDQTGTEGEKDDVLNMPLEAADIQALTTALQNLQPSQSPAQVNATAIKLPSFWQGNPEVWFRQVESVFATCNPAITTQETKF